MRNLPSVLLCFGLVVFANSAPTKTEELPKCNGGQSVIAFALCEPLIDNLKDYIKKYKGQKPPPAVFKNMTIMCEKTTKCLAPLHCKEAQETKKEFDKACDLLHYLNPDIHPCITEFFKKAYLAQSSNETSCLRENAFLEKDLKKRHDAYIKGESCFLDYAKSNCKNSTFNYFSKNYKSFADIISIKPENDNCKDPHHQLNALHCKALAKEFKVKSFEFKEMNFTLNGSRAANMIKLCRDSQTCLIESCAYTDAVRSEMARGCEMLEFLLSDFSQCTLGIKADNPELSKHKCFEGTHLFNTTVKFTCERFHKNKDCLKTIMSDICGKESVKDFDKSVDMVNKQFKCK